MNEIFPTTLLPIALPTISSVVLFNQEQIVCFAFEEKRWVMYDDKGDKHIMGTKLTREYIVGLSPLLISINKGMVFNIKYISEVENITYKCRISTKAFTKEVKFSRREYQEFSKLMKISKTT